MKGLLKSAAVAVTMTVAPGMATAQEAVPEIPFGEIAGYMAQLKIYWCVADGASRKYVLRKTREGTMQPIGLKAGEQFQQIGNVMVFTTSNKVTVVTDGRATEHWNGKQIDWRCTVLSDTMFEIFGELATETGTQRGN